jgi:hypothetical protein
MIKYLPKKQFECFVTWGCVCCNVNSRFFILWIINLDYYQNNRRLSVDIGKLPNHVKSVSLSLLISLFDSIYCSSLLFVVTTPGFLGKKHGSAISDL